MRTKWTRYSIIESAEFRVVVHHPMWYIVFFSLWGFFGGVKGGIADKERKQYVEYYYSSGPPFFPPNLLVQYYSNLSLSVEESGRCYIIRRKKPGMYSHLLR